MSVTISPRDFQAICALSSDCIALLSDDNQLLFSNSSFASLSTSVQQSLINNLNTSDFDRKHHQLENGQQLILCHRTNIASREGQNMQQVLDHIQASDNVYCGVVEALHKALGWHWVYVTTLTEHHANVIARWEAGKLHHEHFQIELVGTPCAQMIRHGRYTFYSDVDTAFPHNQALKDMGAKTYAGTVYRDHEQNIIGHIMALHNERDVDHRHVENVLSLASLCLSSSLLIGQVQADLQHAENEVSSDYLTGLNNRKSFDQDCQRALLEYQEEGHDSALAIIDLNQFKQFNDNRGHQEGDKLLQLFANELKLLGRDSDQAYRLGGDEFGLILSGTKTNHIQRIEDQLTEACQRLSMIFASNVSASIGFSHLSSEGEIPSWVKRADDNMYRQKRSRKDPSAGIFSYTI